jgi:hypothetical protein
MKPVRVGVLPQAALRVANFNAASPSVAELHALNALAIHSNYLVDLLDL